MRWAWLLVLLVAACAPTPASEPIRTEDPRDGELQRANAVLQSQRDELAAQVQTLQADAKHPTFSTWSYVQTIRADHYLALGLQDTFTIRIQFTATTPVRARIMDLSQFGLYLSGRSVDAVDYPATTNLDVTFHDAEGCAGYILVLDAKQDTVISPNITATYAPAKDLTGACAH